MLTPQQINILQTAINGYNFPVVYFDFASNTEIDAKKMCVLEGVISKMLRSPQQQQVKHGLANIIYWGNAQAGYRDYRFKQFLNNVTVYQLQKFQGMVVNGQTPTLRQIKNIGMPQYSGISFISKIVTFLDPAKYCVLDFRIAELRNHSGTKAINNLKINKTQITVTANNCKQYDQWCNECQMISNKYYSGQYRAVDIERGFFHLICNRRLRDAQLIYNAA